ncbi:hypothetical protein P7K49_023208 [Saguinus oedipus]|uniref:Uncharacterized protein n=1 Tax=Saguinus oedipus TaxID=9490 RepID=A0ABQ9UKZ0_SAGOE|nr:hypothetical protein P7K49_023208 [Saguinus oedipus]
MEAVLWGLKSTHGSVTSGLGKGPGSRILKHLKTKDPMQLRLEHLEQGFSVYVNGANAKLKSSPRKAIHSDFSRSASHTEGTDGQRGKPVALLVFMVEADLLLIMDKELCFEKLKKP